MNWPRAWRNPSPPPGSSGHALLTVVAVAVFLGLAVKIPVVPFHAWLPDAYAEAPTPVTMLLTGLLSKMGVYGLLRVFLPIFPEVLPGLAPWLTALAVATVLLGAVAALAQKDLKRILAYSSVNHLGYCVLAVAAVAATQADRDAVCVGRVRRRAAGLQSRRHRLGPVLRHRHPWKRGAGERAA